MTFFCRESCGTCGFKSRTMILKLANFIIKKVSIFSGFNVETQKIKGQQYSDIEAGNFGT